MKNSSSGVSTEKIENIADWDEFIAIGERLTRDIDGAGAIDQWAIPHASDVAMVPLAGGKGDWVDADENPLQPRERFIEALRIIDAIQQAGIHADFSSWSGLWIESFANDTIVMCPIGECQGGNLRNWMAPDVTDF